MGPPGVAYLAQAKAELPEAWPSADACQHGIGHLRVRKKERRGAGFETKVQVGTRQAEWVQTAAVYRGHPH